MASLKEIVTKAVIGKAKKKTTTDLSFTSGEKIDKILGCWIINHHFEGEMIMAKLLLVVLMTLIFGILMIIIRRQV